MRYFQTSRILRWFLFVWVSLVYLWGLLHLFVSDIAAYKCWYSSVTPDHCPPLTLLLSSMRIGQIVAFTLLVLLYAILLWTGLAGKIPQRWYWLSFLLQAGCVFIISLVVRQDNVVLSLYLVLILEAIGTLQKTRFTLLIGGSSLILFVLNEFLSRGIFKSWTTALLSIWVSTDYAALSLFLVGYLILYMQLSQAHMQLEVAHTELEKTHEGLELAASQIETLTRLTERQRLARDLHDTLSQGLVGLKLQLEAIDALLVQRRFDQAKEVVKQAMSYIQRILTGARGAIDDLRSIPVEHRSGQEAVQEAVQRFITATGIPCQADLAALEALPPPFHEHILRFIGEGLANIARHAQARHVWITASRANEILHIELRDDGTGFDPAAVTRQPGHYGLLGLRERAYLLAGDLEIQSAPGAGTRICFSFPLHPGRDTLSHTEKKGGDT